jgi:Mg-chelatase subunit ChlD
MFNRKWALIRQIQYGAGFGLFWVLIFTGIYFQYFHAAPTCLDERQNGGEKGVDCGGSCNRICAFEVTAPTAKWARSFPVTESRYNAVAYIENTNRIAAAPEVTYTFTLYDEQGLITERKGKTILPPDSVYPVFEDRIDTGGRIPTQTFIALDPVDLWLPAQVGRDQFTITDRRLTDADASPRLEAKIRNNELTGASEVEVVATIFDASGNALTASRTFIDDFKARSEATAVFTWPEPIAKTVRSCEVPTDVILAIDLSGSMNNDGDNPPQPITSVLAAAESFVRRLKPTDQAGLVTYATTAKLQQRLTRDVTALANMIAKLTIDPKEETGSTNQGDAFRSAFEELHSELHSKEARKVLVLLTDGLATAPDEDPDEYARQNAALVKGSGISVFTIGLGKDVNMDFVRELASDPNQAFQAVTTADLDRIYKTITASLCEDGAAVIDIVPKTNASFAPLE